MDQWNLPHQWDTGDGRVRWAVFGSGPPVVLLHGTPFSSYIWRKVAPGLAADHRVYVWDMLGFGASDMEAHDVSLQRQTEIFCELLAHWGLDAPRVVAHDVGGAVALRATLLHGVAFSALTLIDAASVSGWGAGGFFRSVHEHPDVFSGLPDWATDALVEAKVRSGSSAGLDPDALRAYLAPWRTAAGRHAFYRQYAQGGEVHTDPLQGLLGSATVPIDVIWGADDDWLDLAYARRLADALPGPTRLAVVPGAGHMVPEDQPAELLRLLRG